MTFVKPFGKMDPTKKPFQPHKRAWRRRRKPMFQQQSRAGLFKRG